MNKLKMKYMKSRAELPVAFLQGVRKIIVASLLMIPIASFASTEKKLFTLNELDAFINVTGKVVDQEGNPVVGATVLVKGTKSGVTTDENGTFRINLPERNTTIVVSYIGYQVREINVAGMTSITVELQPSDAIDEVIVTGYGTQKRSEIVGSVETVTGEELMDIPAPNIAGALRNRVAGVGVSQESGRPGSRISLNIRGATTSDAGGSIGSTSEPLYIIDGITVSADDFDALDASMVENITFLKDASAAIYGAAGAKGVVLVTTKRGKQGKPSISYNGYVGVTDAARRPDMLSSYELAEYLNEGFRMNNRPESDLFSDDDLAYLKGLDTKSWYDQLWQASLMQRHNLSISGGGERVTFFVGGGFQNENGNYAGMKENKYTMRSGLSAKILEGLTADVNFNIDHRIRESQNSLGLGTDNTFFTQVVSRPDWVPMEIDGMPVNFNWGNSENPLALIRSGYNHKQKSQAYRINASLTYQPTFLKGFTAKLQVSQGGGNGRSNEYQPSYRRYNFLPMGNNGQLYSTTLNPDNPEVWGRAPESATLSSSLSRDNSYQGFVTLNYAGTFAGHSVDVVVGGEQTVSDNENMGLRWTDQLLPGFEDHWAFDVNRMQLTSRSIGENTKRSFFGRVNYDFNKKYLLQFVSRLDASSNFARGDRWGLSPSIGAGWIISEENFFKDNVSFVNHLKFKVNYGITGDDRVDERLWQERYVVSLNGGYLFGDDDNNYGIGVNPSKYPNLNITWEKKRTFNFGIESTMWDNKLNLGIEFFQNKVFDGFDKGAENMNPLYAGLIAPVVNYREAYNWGSEFTVGYRTRIGTDWSLNTGINFGWGNSVVSRIIYPMGDLLTKDRTDGKWMGTKLGVDPRTYTSSNIGYRTQGMFRTQEQIDAFLVENPNYTINGQIPQPGWLIYEDTNGDGVINHFDQDLLFDKITPIFSSGINIAVGYKDFNLSTNINARFGGKLFYDGRARTKAGVSTNVPSFWKDRWTPEDPMSGKYPRNDDPYINANSDFWAVNGTTIRINNMTLSYKVPGGLATRLGLGGARVLLTGNNLWTLVNPFSYKDPYTSSVYDYPTVRTISIGLSANL
ncbi:SusC/RagA family TonB-linked outer membrane protein [Sphingobacterium chuzhouense]|nr:TonB-dependent receptor [Sphingobacterium chuzhouense]